MSAANPRIGIIGTGAIGGFGLMLARAGFDVHFLLRSEYDAVLARGLQVSSAVHGPLLLEQPRIYRAAAQMPPCDWLLVGLKHQQPGAGAAHRSGRSTRLQGGGTAERAGCGGCAQAISAGQRAPAGRPVCDLCTSFRARRGRASGLGGSTLATIPGQPGMTRRHNRYYWARWSRCSVGPGWILHRCPAWHRRAG